MTILDEPPLVAPPEPTATPTRPAKPEATPPAPDRLGAFELQPAPAVGTVAPIIVGPPVHVATKRLIDLVGAAGLLVLLSPVLAAAAIAVALRDGRPVLFRQRRIGRDGRPFTMLKFRTMRHDAEARRSELTDRNTRTGPLFKVDHDPRITPTGRILRDTSIDELPQLLNVLTGSMSLVGPRPALEDEVRQFDAELQQRHVVRPGITGLWQTVARDDPNFSAYRRLDLLYVRNWSLHLDGWIVRRTARDIVCSVGRAARRAVHRGRA